MIAEHNKPYLDVNQTQGFGASVQHPDVSHKNVPYRDNLNQYVLGKDVLSQDVLSQDVQAPIGKPLVANALDPFIVFSHQPHQDLRLSLIFVKSMVLQILLVKLHCSHQLSHQE